MPRTRSPRYPAISLPQAAAKLPRLVEAGRQKTLSQEEVLMTLGFGSANGTSLSALSAVLKYGLLHKSGDKYRVTSTAVQMVQAETAKDRYAAIADAFYSTEVFIELGSVFTGRSPNNEELVDYLRGAGYGAAAAGSLVQTYRQSQNFLDEAARSVTASGRQDNFNDAAFRVSVVGSLVEVSARLSNKGDLDRLVTALQAVKELLGASSSRRRSAKAMASRET